MRLVVLLALPLLAPLAQACTISWPPDRPDLSDAQWLDGRLVARLNGRMAAIDVTTGVWSPHAPVSRAPDGLDWSSPDGRLELRVTAGECGMLGWLEFAIDGETVLRQHGESSQVTTSRTMAFAWVPRTGALHWISTGTDGLRTVALPVRGGLWHELAQGFWFLSATDSDKAWILAADGSLEQVAFTNGSVRAVAPHPEGGWVLWTGPELHRLQGTPAGWQVTHLDRLAAGTQGGMAATRGGLVFGDGTVWSWSGSQRDAVFWDDQARLVPSSDGRVVLVQSIPDARLAVIDAQLRSTEFLLSPMPFTQPAYRGPAILWGGSGDLSWALAASAIALSLTALGLLYSLVVRQR